MKQICVFSKEKVCVQYDCLDERLDPSFVDFHNSLSVTSFPFSFE